MFDYETAPFQVETVEATRRDIYTRYDIRYDSPLRGTVPAYLVVPDGSGPFPAIIYMHPGQGDRTTFLGEAESLAKAGVISLLIDASAERPVLFQPPEFSETEATVLLGRQTVMDIRRGVDLLAARRDVDANRIGYVGHSTGATWGGPLAGVEKRLRACVLMAGYPSLTEWARTSEHPFAKEFRSRFTPEALDAYLGALAPLDGIHYINRAAPTPLLFQFASDDEFVTPEQAERYYSVASAPKEVLWYDEDHLFTRTPRARLDRVKWLAKHLGFDPVANS